MAHTVGPPYLPIPTMFHNPSAASWKHSGPSANPAVEPFHRTLPGYAVTPLIPLPDLAKELGLGHILSKDESNRLGLPAFKILGASWAIYKAVAVKCSLPLTASLQELGEAAREANIELVTCTEGNWGRAVARMAKYLQIKAVIFVPDFMDEATQKKIKSEGAKVIVVDGDYDYSIAKARKEADKGGMLVMDVSWEGYDEIPEVELRVFIVSTFRKLTLLTVGRGGIHHHADRDGQATARHEYQRCDTCNSSRRRRIMGAGGHHALQIPVAVCNRHHSRAGYGSESQGQP
jgi:hypothetical protein